MKRQRKWYSQTWTGLIACEYVLVLLFVVQTFFLKRHINYCLSTGYLSPIKGIIGCIYTGIFLIGLTVNYILNYHYLKRKGNDTHHWASRHFVLSILPILFLLCINAMILLFYKESWTAVTVILMICFVIDAISSGYCILLVHMPLDI